MMDHSFVQNRRATTSVFSIKSAAASWKVFKDEEEEEEEEDDTAEEEEIEEVEEMISSRAKKKRLMHLCGGSTTTVGKKVWTTLTAAVAGGRVVAARNPLPAGGCQVEKCVADLTDSKRYHQRHKVCEYHSKAQVVIVSGLTQRFCQQCSRFHEVSEFDDAKRSCRRRLAGHNERRRKHFSSESRREASASATAATGRRGSASASGSQIDKKQCRIADRLTIEEETKSLSENSH